MFGRSFNEISTAVSGRVSDIKRDLQTTHSLAASLKGSDSVFKRLYPAKASIESQKIDVDTLYPKVDKDSFNAKHWLSQLSQVEKKIQNGTKTWQEYWHNLDKNERWIAEYGQRTQGQIRTEDDMFRGNEQLRQEALAQNEALRAQTFSGKATAFVSRSFAAVGNMFAFTAIMEGVQFAIQAVDSWVHANEIAIEKAQEAKSRIAEVRSEYESHQSAAEELGASYDKLSKGVDTSTNTNLSLSDSDYKSYLDITNQLAEAFPSLRAGVDDNGNAILSLGQHGRTASEELAELLRVEEELNGYKISQDVDTAFKGMAIKVKEAEESEAQNQGSQESLEVIKNVLTGNITSQEENEKPPVIFRISGDLANETDAAYYNAIFTGLKNFKSSLDPDRQMQLNGLLDPGSLMQAGTDGKFDFQLNLSPLSEEEKAEVFSQIKLQADIPLGLIDKQLYDEDQERLFNEHELEQEWKQSLPSLMEQTKSQFDFQSLEESEYGQEMQDFALDMVSNLDKSVAAEMEKSGGAGRWVRDSILLPLNNLDGSGRETVSAAYKNLLELDPDDLSEQTQAQIDKYTSLIAGKLGKKSEDIRLNLGFQVDEGWKEKYDEAVANSSQNLGSPDSEIKKTFTDLGIDNSREIDKWMEHTVNAKSLTEAIEMYKNARKADAQTFSEAWEDLGLTEDDSLKSLQNGLLSLAEAGQLTMESFNNTKGSEAFLAKLGLEPEDTQEVQNVIEKVNQLVSSSEQLASMKKGISGLTENLQAKMETPGKAIGSDVLAGMDESLKAQTEEWENYQSVMGSASSTIEEAQEATDRLAAAFLNNNNFLANLTESEKGYYISQLEAIGIGNAEELVQQKLLEKQQFQELSLKALELTKYGVNEQSRLAVLNLLDEANAADEVRYALLDCIVQQQIFAENSDLGVYDKIEQLKLLIEHFYGAAEAASFYNSTKVDHKKDGNGGAQNHYETISPKQAYENAKNSKKNLGNTAPKITPRPSSRYSGSSRPTPTQTKTETPENFNFIETAIARIKTKIDEAKNAAKEAFASFKSRRNYYASAISKIGKEIDIQTQADKIYMERAKKVELDEKYAAQVRDGSLNIETVTDEGMKKRIREYKEWYEKALACQEAVKALKKEQQELAREKIELRITKYEKRFSKLDTKNNRIKNFIDVKEAWGFSAGKSDYTDMNKNIRSQLGNIRTQNNELARLKKTVSKGSEAWYEYDKRMQSNNETAQNLKKAMVENARAAAALPKAKADKKISKYDSADEMIDAKLDNLIRPKLKNGLINQKIDNIKHRQDTYNAAVKEDRHNIKASRGGLKKITKTKANKNILKQVLALSKAGKLIPEKLLKAAYNLKDNGKLYNACILYNSYREAYEADKATAKLYAQTSKQDKANLAIERFNNTAAGYDYSLAENEQKKAVLNSKIALDEEQGRKPNLAYYERLLSAENGTQRKLIAKRNALQNSLNLAVSRELIKVGSDEWYEMVEAINSVTNEINESINSTAELKNTIRQIKWDTFDASLETIKRINSEADFLIDLMGKNKDLIDKDNGEFTDYGKATLTLYKQQYESYLAQADEYTKEYNNIMKQVGNGELSLDDDAVAQRLRELQDLQRDSKLSAEDILSSIIDLIRNGYEAQLDALDKLIQKYKDLRQNEKDAYEYQKNIAEKTKNIATLQKQLYAYEGNDTEEARAKIQKLKVDLEDARQDLAEAEYDKYFSDMNDMLDGLYDDFESFIDEKLNDTDAILAMINDSLCGKSDSIIATLASLNGPLSSDLQELLKGNISSSMYVNNIIESDKNAQKKRQQEEEDKQKKEALQKGRELESKARTAQWMMPAVDNDIATEKENLSNMQKRLNYITEQEKELKKAQKQTNTTVALPIHNSSLKYYAKEKKLLTEGIADSKKRIQQLNKQRKDYKADIDAYETWKKNHKDLEFLILYPDAGLTFVSTRQATNMNSGSETVSTDSQVQAQFLEYAQMPPEDVRTLLHIEPQPAYAAPAIAPDLQRDLDVGNVNVAINELNLPGVTNYEDFKAALIRDNKFEKAVQSMTIDRAVGGHPMAKLKHI